MKKIRLLPLLLSLCMVLAAVPGTAGAFAVPPDSDYWVNLTQEQTEFMLDRIAGKTETRDVVLICYPSYGAANISTAVTQFSDYAGTGVKMYSFAFSDEASGLRLAEKLSGLVDSPSESWPDWPIAVTYNASQKTCLAKEYIVTLSSVPGSLEGLRDLMLENGVGGGSSGADPEVPGPDPDPDPAPGPDPDPDPAPDPEPDVIPDPGPDPIPLDMSAQGWEVLRRLNRYRMGRGLEPLSAFSALQKTADLRAREIYQDYRPDHTRPDGRLCWTAYSECGVFYHYSAENIASGQRDAADVMNSWLNSPGHHRNMVSSKAVHVGVGFFYGTSPSAGQTNWTQDFAAASDCRFSGMVLSSSEVYGSLGADLETVLEAANITVTARCYRHGECSLPLIAAMCSGYDPAADGEQTLTVAYGGQTASLRVIAPHSWDGGAVTEEPSCTQSGTRTYRCATPDCGAFRTEIIPALGHDFSGGLACAVCGAEAEAVLEDLLQTALAGGRASGWTEEEARAYAGDLAAQQAERLGLPRDVWEIATLAFLPPVNGTAEDPSGSYGRYDYTVSARGGRQLLSAEAAASGRTLRLYLEPVTDRPADVDDTTLRPPVQPDRPIRPIRPVIPVSPAEPDREESAAPAPVTYRVDVPASVTGGTVQAAPASAGKDRQVTVTVRPGAGYVLETLTVTDSAGNELDLTSQGEGKYTFRMPGGNVSVQASFRLAETPWSNPYRDAAADMWYYDAVEYVSRNGLMAGVASDAFAPDARLSRAMLAQILYNKAGRPAVSGGSAFTDVPGGAWCAGAVTWAAANGIVNGYGGGTFGPDDGVTREQLAVMLWRYAGEPAAGGELPFSDAERISGFARSAVAWAAGNGVLQGTGGGALDPQGFATRAQAAQMLKNYFA